MPSRAVVFGTIIGVCILVAIAVAVGLSVGLSKTNAIDFSVVVLTPTALKFVGQSGNRFNGTATFLFNEPNSPGLLFKIIPNSPYPSTVTSVTVTPNHPQSVQGLVTTYTPQAVSVTFNGIGTTPASQPLVFSFNTV